MLLCFFSTCISYIDRVNISVAIIPMGLGKGVASPATKFSEGF
jgi:hypothetical protein